MVALNWKKLNPEFQLKQILSLLHYSSTPLLQQTSASRKNPKSPLWRQLRSRSSQPGFFSRLSRLHSPLFPRLGLALLVFSIFIFFSPNAHADQVTLAWDASSGADGYRIFSRQNGQSYNYSSPAWEGSATFCTIDLDSDSTYYLVVRAYNAYGESGDSDEASITIGSPVVTPDLDYIEIEGPVNVSENTTVDYSCRAHYTDGTSLLVEPDTWDVDCSYANISTTGLLSTYDVDSDQACQITATYAEDAITRANTHDLTIGDYITPPPTDIEVIIDNGGSGTSYTGTWEISSCPDPFAGSSLYSRDQAATYSFDAAVEGLYEVYLWYTSCGTRCERVRIEVSDSSGIIDTFEVDQTRNAGQWNLVDRGPYYFYGLAKVTIFAVGAYCSTCVDAVRLVSIGNN